MHPLIDSKLQQAVALHGQGAPDQAASLYRDILLADADQPDALHLLGVALIQLGRPNEAVALIERSLAVNPLQPAALADLGNARLAAGEAMSALASYDRAVAMSPDYAIAHNGRGNALLALGRAQAALSSFERALQLMPGLVQTLNNWGNALVRLKRFDQALDCYDRALAARRAYPQALINRGSVLAELRRLPEALRDFDQALNLNPMLPEAHYGRGRTLMALERPDEAIGAYQQALQAKPDYLAARFALGMALSELGRFEPAVDCLSTLQQAQETYDYVSGIRLHAQLQLCAWRDFERSMGTVVAANDRGARADYPLSFLALSDSGGRQLRCARTFVADRYAAGEPLWRGQQYAHERLRVAYLSADFHDHPVSHLLAGVLERHDRARFETLGISLRDAPRGQRDGAMRQRMRRAFEHFHEVGQVGDLEVARRLRELQVDIAIDLGGHTRGGRLGILACRPAPLQVSYLGFAGSSGADYIDYLIADEVVIPAGCEGLYSERIVRLPYSFLPNDDRQSIAEDTPTRREVGLPDEGVVFCAFNNAYKINPAMFEVWMDLLRHTPGSALWLREGSPAMAANLRREAQVRGVEPGRLVFAPAVAAMEHHLARYRLADLFLDTWPYGAHATARDALWAGLPVLTCTGEAFASRVAASLLRGLGLSELVSTNLQHYAQCALSLAHSPKALRQLRERLIDCRTAHPLFDTDRYRRDLESALLRIGQTGSRGVGDRRVDRSRSTAA